ncbi:hypothetical protein IR145_12195 [Streptococcus danieliae]|nr:hypothetical protein [Streptococcus danieliae]
MVLAEDELIIEEVLFIHKNFEIYTVSDFAKKLNHKKEVVRQAVRQYGFRDFEDGVSKDYFIYKIIFTYTIFKISKTILPYSLSYNFFFMI